MKNLLVSILLLTFAILPSCSGKNEPKTAELKNALIQNVPGHIEVVKFAVEAIQNFGSEVDPNIGSRFKATVGTTVNLYKKKSVKNGVIFVFHSSAVGNQAEIFGKITSNLYQGAWRHRVAIEGNPIPNMGIPLNQFTGSRVLIRGSAEEKQYFLEIKRKKEEQRQNLANAKTIIVGKWRYEGGLSTCKSDGTWHEIWDKGDEGEFLWDIKGDIIELTWKRYKPKNGKWKTSDGGTQRQQIIFIDNNRYTTKDKKGKVSSSARVQ